MLIASSINGFVFGLISGQPLLILGPTGPFLVFEEMVYDVSIVLEEDDGQQSALRRYLGCFSVMPIVEFRLLDSTMLC